MVAWLHGCMVAWLHGCMVAWLHGFHYVPENDVLSIHSTLFVMYADFHGVQRFVKLRYETEDKKGVQFWLQTVIYWSIMGVVE